MLDSETRELIHQEIDGANSPEASRRLKAILKTHPEARELYEELASMGKLLEQMEAVEPPATLKPSIMASVRRRQTPQPARTPWFRRSISLLQKSATPRYALAFAFGMAAMLLILQIFKLPPGSGTQNLLPDITGTMLPPQQAKEAALVERVNFSASGIEGVLTLRRLIQALVVELQAESAVQARFVLAYDAGAFSVAGIGPSGVMTSYLIQNDPGNFAITAAGKIDLSTVFQITGIGESPLIFAIQQAGATVYSQALDLSKR